MESLLNHSFEALDGGFYRFGQLKSRQTKFKSDKINGFGTAWN